MSLLDPPQIRLLAALGLALLACQRLPTPRPRMLRVAGLLTGIALAVETVAFLISLPKLNNTAVYNLFLPLEFLLVLTIIRALRQVSGRYILAALLLGMAGLLANMLLIAPRASVLFEAAVAFAVLLVMLLFGALWGLADTSPIALHRLPEFWLLIGMLVYFAGLVPVVGLARFLAHRDPVLASTLWTIMPMLATTRYLLAAYAFWLQRRGPADAA